MVDKITLRAARVNAGLSQEEMANKLGIHRQTLAYFEKEPEKMSIEMAKNVCRILDVNIDQIFFSSNLQNVELRKD